MWRHIELLLCATKYVFLYYVVRWKSLKTERHILEWYSDYSDVLCILRLMFLIKKRNFSSPDLIPILNPFWNSQKNCIPPIEQTFPIFPTNPHRENKTDMCTLEQWISFNKKLKFHKLLKNYWVSGSKERSQYVHCIITIIRVTDGVIVNVATFNKFLTPIPLAKSIYGKEYT